MHEEEAVAPLRGAGTRRDTPGAGAQSLIFSGVDLSLQHHALSCCVFEVSSDAQIHDHLVTVDPWATSISLLFTLTACSSGSIWEPYVLV